MSPLVGSSVVVSLSSAWSALPRNVKSEGAHKLLAKRHGLNSLCWRKGNNYGFGTFFVQIHVSYMLCLWLYARLLSTRSCFGSRSSMHTDWICFLLFVFLPSVWSSLAATWSKGAVQNGNCRNAARTSLCSARSIGADSQPCMLAGWKTINKLSASSVGNCVSSRLCRCSNHGVLSSWIGWLQKFIMV